CWGPHSLTTDHLLIAKRVSLLPAFPNGGHSPMTFSQLFRSFFRTLKKSVRKKPTKLQLALEKLEDRTVPTTYTWAGTAGGSFNWNDPANWSPNTGYPNAVDDVADLNVHLSSNATITVNGNFTLGQIVLGDPSASNTYTLANGGAGTGLTLSASS